jgi:hypothetical protein
VGFAFPNASNTFGLDVRVTTEAKNIAFIRPGGGLEPELLSIGLFTQLANDPTLIAGQVVIAVLFSVFQILGSAASWMAGRRSARQQIEPGREAFAPIPVTEKLPTE